MRARECASSGQCTKQLAIPRDATANSIRESRNAPNACSSTNGSKGGVKFIELPYQNDKIIQLSCEKQMLVLPASGIDQNKRPPDEQTELRDCIHCVNGRN